MFAACAMLVRSFNGAATPQKLETPLCFNH
jgi:hypothetical protein